MLNYGQQASDSYWFGAVYAELRISIWSHPAQQISLMLDIDKDESLTREFLIVNYTAI